MAVTAGRVGAAIRDEFPIFAHTTYLNSCSQGALSHRVRAAYEEYVDGWDANGAEWAVWVERADAARAAFSRLLHAEPAELAVTTSVTQGVSGIVSTLDLRARPRIVISEYEFPTVGQIAHAQELRGEPRDALAHQGRERHRLHPRPPRPAEDRDQRVRVPDGGPDRARPGAARRRGRARHAGAGRLDPSRALRGGGRRK